MTSILFLIGTNERNQFRCKYLKKGKNILRFFSEFLKFASKIEYFERKCDPQRLQNLIIFLKTWPSRFLYFRNYGLRKTCSDQRLKGAVSQNYSNIIMVNDPKNCATAPSSDLLITVNWIELEKVSLSNTKNLTAVG